jgi:hypothetical protein
VPSVFCSSFSLRPAKLRLQSGGKDKGDAEFPGSCGTKNDVNFLTKSACVTVGRERVTRFLLEKK